jgi:6-phosphogluconolactonase
MRNRICLSAIPIINTYATSEEVGKSLSEQFVNIARKEIDSKGSFFVAIPGGSAIKLFKYLVPLKNKIDWSKVYLFYVNHKYVPENDDSATHFKAKSIFLNDLGEVKTYVPDSTKPSVTETALAYSSQLVKTLPTKNGLPFFDLVVLGMGKDGHIGSLYPGRKEVLETSLLVVPVDKVFVYLSSQLYTFTILFHNLVRKIHHLLL